MKIIGVHSHEQKLVLSVSQKWNLKAERNVHIDLIRVAIFLNRKRLLYGNARAVKLKITFPFKPQFMSRDNFKIEIPEIANTKMKLFVNDE